MYCSSLFMMLSTSTLQMPSFDSTLLFLSVFYQYSFIFLFKFSVIVTALNFIMIHTHAVYLIDIVAFNSFIIRMDPNGR
jgi:hypothetical protein